MVWPWRQMPHTRVEAQGVVACLGKVELAGSTVALRVTAARRADTVREAVADREPLVR